MAETVLESFKQLNSRLIPTLGSAAVHNHRGSIKECLVGHFNLTSFFQVGSIINGTDIRGHSHTDYFAVIPPYKLRRNSDETLLEMRLALVGRFPMTNGIRIETPSIVIPFGEHAIETTRVIPAEFLRKRGELAMYEVPDRNGSWMVASPVAHNDYITYANTKRGREVKPLIRFLKAWKYYKEIPINSFYLEVYAARYALEQERVVFQRALFDILQLWYKHNLPSIYDPLKIEGEIFPCQSESDRERVINDIKRDLPHIELAVSEEIAGRVPSALRYWSKFFSGNF